jgi:hypothetical protein
MKDKINKLATNRTKTFRGINEFKKGYQPRTY